MAPLIGITGEQKPAMSLVDVLDVLRGSDIDVFYSDFARSVLRAGGMPVWIPADAPSKLVDRIDGLLLSGGEDIDPAAYGQDPHPALGAPSAMRDNHERDLLDAALRAEVPTLGVCRGAQLVNVHLGGTLHQHLPAHTDTSVPIDQAFHRVAFVDGSIGHQVVRRCHQCEAARRALLQPQAGGQHGGVRVTCRGLDDHRRRRAEQ